MGYNLSIHFISGGIFRFSDIMWLLFVFFFEEVHLFFLTTSAISSFTYLLLFQIQNKLTKAAYPNTRSVPGLIAFVNTWLRCEHDVADIDSNSGLPPVTWIEEIKCAVKDVYMKLKSLYSIFT